MKVNGGGIKAAGGLAIARAGVLMGEEALVGGLVIPKSCWSGSSVSLLWSGIFSSALAVLLGLTPF